MENGPGFRVNVLALVRQPSRGFQSMPVNSLFTNSNAKPRDEGASFDAKQRDNSDSGVRGISTVAQTVTTASGYSEGL